MNIYYLNIISTALLCMVLTYMVTGYLLQLFKYYSLHKRYYKLDDIPLYHLSFFGIIGILFHDLYTGIHSEPTLSTFGLVVVGFGVVCTIPLCGLFFAIMYIDKLRNKLPER